MSQSRRKLPHDKHIELFFLKKEISKVDRVAGEDTRKA